MAIPAFVRMVDRAPSAATSSRVEIALPSESSTERCWAPPGGENFVTADVRNSTPTSFAFATSASTRSRFSIMWANGSPGSMSPPKVRKTGRTASSSRLSVMAISMIGCAFALTLSQTPRASNSRRAAATIAEARSSPDWRAPSAGSATTTENDGPSACRKAIASERPAKLPPAISTSTSLRAMIGSRIAAARQPHLYAPSSYHACRRA